MTTLVLAHDAKDIDQHLDTVDPVIAWLQAHGLNPNHIYRFEIHTIDTRLIRVFEFLRDADDRMYCAVDHDHRSVLGGDCEAARREPYDVLLRFDPPAELLAAHTHPEETR